MHVALNGLACRNVAPRGTGLLVLATAAAFGAATATGAQNAPATPPAQAQGNPPPSEAAPQTPIRTDRPPVFSSPLVAIVPLDQSIPGAALSVEGPLQAWNGRAFITGSGTVTAGAETAQVTLPRRGTLRVCALSSVNLEADTSAPVGEFPGLLIALDHGAIEMSFAASSARQHTADTLLTPFFRILVGGPSAADVKVRLGQDGDTCVDNYGVDAPYVVVSSVFDSGLYRVQPGQRVMFQRGSLQSVVDQEREPCGCPPAAEETPKNVFPLAQSEGLAPLAQVPSRPAAAQATQPNGGDQAVTTLMYKGGEKAPEGVAIPAPAAAPPAPPPAAPAPATTPPTVAPAAAPASQPVQTDTGANPQSKKKRGIFGKVGHFFKKVFGGE